MTAEEIRIIILVQSRLYEIRYAGATKKIKILIDKLQEDLYNLIKTQ